jgi:polar amino acid transport system substrate-binding protein
MLDGSGVRDRIRGAMTRAWPATGFVAVVLLASGAMTSSTSAAGADLAPTGKLRAGINYGNFILARKDPSTGESRGVAIDLARELGRRLGASVELVAYETVAAMVDAARAGAWDIAFLGIDPARAGEISFSPAYLEIEATYLVPAGSPLRVVADVDRDGVRVAAPARANYELFLSRHLQRAQLVRAPSAEAAFDLLATAKADALAGLKQALIGLADRLPGSRMLDGRFMAVQQAIGVPKGRDAGLPYLRDFVEDAKASGLVGRAIEQTGARGVSVAPSAR